MHGRRTGRCLSAGRAELACDRASHEAVGSSHDRTRVVPVALHQVARFPGDDGHNAVAQELAVPSSSILRGCARGLQLESRNSWMSSVPACTRKTPGCAPRRLRGRGRLFDQELGPLEVAVSGETYYRVEQCEAHGMPAWEAITRSLPAAEKTRQTRPSGPGGYNSYDRCAPDLRWERTPALPVAPDLAQQRQVMGRLVCSGCWSSASSTPATRQITAPMAQQVIGHLRRGRETASAGMAAQRLAFLSSLSRRSWNTARLRGASLRHRAARGARRQIPGGEQVRLVLAQSLKQAKQGRLPPAGR